VCPAGGSWNGPRGSFWGALGSRIEAWMGSNCPRGLEGCDGKKQTIEQDLMRR